MKNLRMLVPLDSSPISVQTVKNIIGLGKQINQPVTLVHVLDLDLLACQGFAETSLSAFETRARQQAINFLTSQQQLFQQAGIASVTLLKEGSARDLICALADSGDYDLLVMGRNPVSQVRDLLFGQVSNYVIHRVKCPVLIL